MSGVGYTRSFVGVHLGCYCMYFNSSGNIVSTKHYKRKGIHRTPGFLLCFRGFEFWGWISWVLVVVVAVVVEKGSGPVSGVGCTRSFVRVQLSLGFFPC